MVMEVQPVASGSSSTQDSSSAQTVVPWTRIDLDLYEIAAGGRVVGYVEEAGPVFVALRGPRYDRAVEVCQALTFHAAVDAVLRWR